MRRILFFYLVGSFCLLAACAPGRFQQQRLAISGDLSIPVSIILYASRVPDWNRIYNQLNQYARLFDYRTPGNSMWQLNHEFKAIPEPEVISVIHAAIRIAEQSQGAFDPTILPLLQIWNLEEALRFTGSSQWQVPEPAAITAARQQVNYQKIQITSAGEVAIPAGMGVDLGGIAKGAIVDLLADFLNSLGYRDFLIEAGGDILISGLKPAKAASFFSPGNRQETAWSLAIRHPRVTDGYLLTLLLGKAGQRLAIVTSGDYERFIEVTGKRYHHLLDPATGYPATGNISVSVTAPTCREADALATAAFIMGFQAGTDFLENLPGVEGLLIKTSGSSLEAAMTSGFPAEYTDLNL